MTTETMCGAHWNYPKMMTPDQAQTSSLFTKTEKILLVNECCNYYEGICKPLDTKCPQLKAETIICDWFTEAVLPLRTGLKTKYNPTRIEEKPVQIEKKQARMCALCKKVVVVGHAQYCPKCAKKQERMRKRKYKQKVGSKATI